MNRMEFIVVIKDDQLQFLKDAVCWILGSHPQATGWASNRKLGALNCFIDCRLDDVFGLTFMESETLIFSYGEEPLYVEITSFPVHISLSERTSSDRHQKVNTDLLLLYLQFFFFIFICVCLDEAVLVCKPVRVMLDVTAGCGPSADRQMGLTFRSHPEPQNCFLLLIQSSSSIIIYASILLIIR